MKRVYLVLIILAIFVLSFAFRYAPLAYKGYSYNDFADNLILARNLDLTSTYRIDSQKNVVLSSEVVAQEGVDSNIGNKLTSILYAWVFKVFGFSQSLPLYLSLLLYALTSVILFLLVFRLFNLPVALLFSLFDVFAPLVFQYAITPGMYEWAIFFFSLGFLIYLYPKKSGDKNHPEKLITLFLAGIFLALASLTRNSLLLAALAFFIYDFWQTRSFKRIIVFVLPLVIFWGIYLGPTYLHSGNSGNTYLGGGNYSGYLHFMPDSYTWFYDRDNYIATIIDDTNYDYIQGLAHYGYPTSLKNRLLMYWASIKSYPMAIFDQTMLGGPLILLFMMWGGIYLYKKDRGLLKFFGYWLIVVYIFLVILGSNHWGHLLSLEFPLFVLAALGSWQAIQFIKKQTIRKNSSYALNSIFVILLFLHLIQSDKWAFHEAYTYSNIEPSRELVELVKDNESELNRKNDVIAVGLDNQLASLVNWQTDFSAIYFDEETIKKLLEEDKLEWAFDQFKVTAVLGYSPELMAQISQSSNVKTIE